MSQRGSGISGVVVGVLTIVVIIIAGALAATWNISTTQTRNLQESLDELRLEIAEARANEHVSQSQEESASLLGITNRVAFMAGAHVGFIDVGRTIERIDDLIGDGDLDEVGEELQKLRVILSHTQWPENLEHGVGEFQDKIEPLQHALAEENVDEARDAFLELQEELHHLTNTFYNSYLTSLIEAESRSFRLGTQLAPLAGFLGGGGEIEGEINPIIRVKVGETVKITIENLESLEHDFLIDELHVHSEHLRQIGEISTIIFTAHTPGTYTYYCSVPGHREAGMEGTIIVEA